MNSRLTSSYFRSTQVQLQNGIVAFDKHGNCVGVIRYATGHPLKRAEQVTQAMLDEASESPGFYRVTDESGKVLEPKSVRDRKAQEEEAKAAQMEAEVQELSPQELSPQELSPQELSPQELADSETELVEDAKAVYEQPISKVTS